ncbi:MAG: tRNA (adenosine(37)-N6)-threonylcarbamoyltransferase complex dimerization subunit type 1 TsaB [Vicinamibacterales bacterium]
MRVLALDTTTRAGSVAVLADGRVVAQSIGDAARTQAERLPREILEALAAASLTTHDVDLFAVAAGPGSFTGLRIGIATVQGLAFVHGRPVAPVSALRALAEAAAVGADVGQRVAAWMDGHRKEVFSALYEVEARATDSAPSRLLEIESPTAEPPASVLARWSVSGLPRVICGDGTRLYGSLVPPGVQTLDAPPLAPIVGRLGAVSATVAPAALQPLYVRRPDVELNRDAARTRP